MATTLLQARARVRAWLRSNGYDSTLYPDAIIDTAISDCGEELARLSILLQQNSDLTLTNGSPALPAMPTGFRPDRLMSAYLIGDNVQVVPPQWAYAPYCQIGAPANIYGNPRSQLGLMPYQQLLELEYAYRTAIPQGSGGSPTLFSGQPQIMAFTDRTGIGKVFPCPNQDYTMRMVWNALFTNWTIGTQGAWSASTVYQPGDVVSSGGNLYQAIIQNSNIAVGTASTWTSLGAGSLTAPGSVTFQIPDDYLNTLIIWGCPATVQFNEPLGAFAESARVKWNKFVKDMGDQGDLGENFFQQEPAQRGGGAYGGVLGFGFFGGN